MTGAKGFAVGVLVMIVTLALSVPALAGGSWLEPSFVRVEPGDTLMLSGPVSRGQLGWVEDGPFFAYLSGPSTVVITSVYGGAETDVPLGEIRMEQIDSNNMQLSIEVTIPADTPPGEYWVTHCNDPCASGFGDLIGSHLFVGMDPTVTTAEATTTSSSTTASATGETAPDSTTAAATLDSTTTTDTIAASAGEASGPWNADLASEPSSPDRSLQLAVVLVALVVGLGVLIAYRRRRSA